MNFKQLLITLTPLLVSGCSTIGDFWSGDDKKVKLPGERISINYNTLNLNVIKNNNKVVLSAPQHVMNVESSSGIDSILYPNIRLDSGFDLKATFSFNASKLFSSVTSPIIVDDKIITLESDGTIVALDKKDGKKLWSNQLFKAERNILKGTSQNYYLGGLLHYNGVIYITSGNDVVTALSADSGQKKWQINLLKPTRSIPVVDSNMIYIQTLDNSTYALDINDGQIKWMHVGSKGEISLIGTLEPILKHDILIVQYNNGEIVGINAKDGSEIWSINVITDIERFIIQRQVHNIKRKVVIDENLLIAYGNNGVVGVFDIRTGIKVWKKKLEINRPLWIANNLCVGLTSSDQLIAFDKMNGDLKWVTDLKSLKDKINKEEVVWMEPQIINNKVVVINSQGKLFEFDVDDGTELNMYEIAKHIYTQPIIVQNSLYLTSNEGKIYQYGG